MEIYTYTSMSTYIHKDTSVDIDCHCSNVHNSQRLEITYMVIQMGLNNT